MNINKNYKNPRIVNQQGGILLEGPSGRDLYIDTTHPQYDDVIAGEFGEVVEMLIDIEPEPTIEFYADSMYQLYDKAMIQLQNRVYEQKSEIIPFKLEAVQQFDAGGIAGLSASNREMIAELAGTNAAPEIESRINNIRAEFAAFKLRAAKLEFMRDSYLDQLSREGDNSALVEALRIEYDALLA